MPCISNMPHTLTAYGVQENTLSSVDIEWEKIPCSVYDFKSVFTFVSGSGNFGLSFLKRNVHPTIKDDS